MENVKATLTEAKESTRQFLGKKVELGGGQWILVGMVLFMAGMMIGMLIAPFTQGIQISLFSHNGNNNGNNSNGNQATLVGDDEKDDKNKKKAKGNRHRKGVEKK